MPPITVDQGLSQKDPIVLAPGELSRADNAYYKVTDPMIYRMKGRTKVNATPEASAVKGILALQFNSGGGFFVTLVGTTYRKGTIGRTTTFADFITGLSPLAQHIDSVYTNNNQHVVMNHVDRNRVVSADGTALLHGMLAQVLGPEVRSTSGVGTGFTLSSGSTITYWVEERVKVNGVVVKRSASTILETTTLTGTGAVVKPVIVHAAFVNPDTTHWAVFATGTNIAFPQGGQVGEADITVGTIEDTRTGTDPVIPAGGNYQVYTTTDEFGISQSVARNGAPPIAASGDMMNDCLVLVDATDTSRLVYSIVGAIHQFPVSNVIRFPSKDQDQLVAFRYVGSVGVALLRDSAWAVNTLPRPDDSSFSPDRVKKQIDGAQGVVGEHAVALFSFGEGAMLAYVSPGGVVWTDTRSWGVVTDDLDWPNLVEPTMMDKIRLTNNADLYRLEMRYTPKGGTRNTKMILLNYHPFHLKYDAQGRAKSKITGPIDLPANDAAVAIIDNQHRIFTANEDGYVYLEDEGFVAQSGEALVMDVETRDEAIAGIGGEIHLRNLLIHHGASDGASATITVTQRVHGQAEVAAATTIALTYREATPTFTQGMADVLRFRFTQDGANRDVSLAYFVPLFEASQMEGA